MPLHVMEQPPRFFALAYRVSAYGIDIQIVKPEMTKFKMFRESKHGFLVCGNYILKFW
jgi:hypothetical protein